MSYLSAHPEFPICLDGRNWQPGGTGVHSYARALSAALGDCGIPTSVLLDRHDESPRRPYAGLKNLMSALTGRALPVKQLREGNFIVDDLYRKAHTRFRLLHKLTKIDLPASEERPKLMHWTVPLPVQARGMSNIVTLHDIIPLTHPELTGIAASRFDGLIRRLLDTVDGIATVSETVRSQILSHFGLAPNRVRNLYQPVAFDDALLHAIDKAEPIVPDGGFVFVGRIESRKNIDRLLKAHALSLTRRPLSLIGPDGDDRPDCSARGSTSQVVRIPWCEKANLLRTLAGARALLFPSLAEGFGLPIIEAMALGTPVMTSYGGATEEIAGSAALLVNPYDVSEMAAAIALLDNDKDGPPVRQRLSARGLERAALFTQAAFSTRLRAFYREINPAFPC